MGISLGANQYGKAETHLVRITRDGDHHQIRDLTVSTALRGDFDAAHLVGDQANVLPTDTQKNTVFALAKEHAAGPPEAFGLALARHFVDTVAPVEMARVRIDEAAWQRIMVDGVAHDHAFTRTGAETRTATVTAADAGDQRRAWVVSGLRDLVVLKSTGSEFRGFLTDELTTLPETDDRVLATSLEVRWRVWPLERDDPGSDWDERYARVRELLLSRFATVHSLALQQSLWEMGKAVLEAEPAIDDIRLTAPNLHHVLVDLEPFGRENRGEIYFAADRPYGLIRANVVRDERPHPGLPWSDDGAW